MAKRRNQAAIERFAKVAALQHQLAGSPSALEIEKAKRLLAAEIDATIITNLAAKSVEKHCADARIISAEIRARETAEQEAIALKIALGGKRKEAVSTSALLPARRWKNGQSRKRKWPSAHSVISFRVAVI